MAVSAIIKDGQIQETASESSAKKANATNSSGMDKDAFLQLLVAQMKYQDPLEPTSNTEYISQYATFSQVEQMQNMASTMELSRASSMVGQLVEITTTTASGDTKTLQGVVDYVTYENNKAYVSIDGTSYSADDVTAVISQDYQSAYDLAVSFAVAMNKLPSLDQLTVSDKESVEALQSVYNSMTSYQQDFVASDYVTKLQQYITRMDELVKAQEEAGKADETQAAEDMAGTQEDEVQAAEDAAGTQTDEAQEAEDTAGMQEDETQEA